MGLIKKSLGAILLFAFPLMVLAQDELTTIQYAENTLEFIGGLKGAGILVIVAGVVQLIMQFFKTPLATRFFPDLSGKAKLLIVSGLTVVGGVLGLMADGQPFMAAILHSSTLAALQVFANQLFRKFAKSKKS